MAIRLGAADLEYLLAQVKIGADYSKLAGALDPGGVREVNGRNNNLVGGYDADGNWVPASNIHADWGQADTDFLRLSQTDTPGTGNSWGTTYDPLNPSAGPFGNVNVDMTPRLISNLISSSVIDSTSPAYNPAAAAAMEAMAPHSYPVEVNNSVVGALQGAGLPDQGILGGVPFNEFFVAFGQFFDHGLDFITKGGGYTMITLSPNDPLYVPPTLANGDRNPEYIPGASNVMMLSRASLSNPDGDFYTAEDVAADPDNLTASDIGALKAGVTPQFNNNTGLLIDQSQTYGSDASVNALVRQYDDQGRPTGLLITSAEDGKVYMPEVDENGKRTGVINEIDLNDPANADALQRAEHDMATWSDMKTNAMRLGIELVDTDVFDTPSMLVDPTGNLMFDPAAVLDAGGNRVYYRAAETLADMAARTGVDLATLEAHDPFARDASGMVLHTNQAILIDINTAADPSFHSDIDPGTNAERVYIAADGNSYDYDVDLLNRHYVSGDGRVNENIGLTSVHHVFHEEHNIEVLAIENGVLQEAANMLAGGATMADAAAYVNAWTRTDAGTSDATSELHYLDFDGNDHTIMIEGVNIDDQGAVAWDGNSVYQASRIITETEYNHIAIDQYVNSLAVLPEFVSYSADINVDVSLEFSQAIFRLGHSQLTEYMNVAVPLVVDGVSYAPGTPEWNANPQFGAGEQLFDAFLNPDGYSQYGAAGLAIGLMRQTSNDIDEFVTPAMQQTLLGVPLDLAAINIARGRDVGLPTLNELREQIYNQVVQLNGSSGSGSAIAPYTSWADFGNHLATPESLVNFIASYGRDDDTWHLASLRQSYLEGTADANDPTADGTVTLADLRANAQRIVDAYADASDSMHAAAVKFMIGEPVYHPETHSVDSVGADLGFWDIDLWIGGLAERPLFDGPLGTTFSMIMLDFGQRMQDGDRFYYLYRMPVGQHLGDQIIGEQFADLIQRTTGTEHTGDAFGSQSAFYELGSGNDVWQASTAGSLADGTPVQDGHLVVAGNGGDDYIAGGLGDDYLYGDDGADTLNGSQGNDHIYGGAGNDWITDDENDDFIDGGDGDDVIFAGPGVLDTSHGGSGNDEVHGGDGVDEVFGDDGDDALFGEGDTDLIMGGDGNDYMDGGDSVDEMFGGNGNDWMRGGVGDDNINGGSGNDLMEGGLGPTANDGDRLNGDTVITGQFVVEFNGDGSEGYMDIASYEEAMIPIFASLQDANANGTSSNLADTYAFVEGLVGSAQNDRLTGADANATTSNGADNYLVGGGGNDVLSGLGGNDFIFGDSVVVDSDLYWSGDDYHQYVSVNNTDPDNVTYEVRGDHLGVKSTDQWVTEWGELRPVYNDGSKGHVLGDNGAEGDADIVVFSGNHDDYTVTTSDFVDEFGQTRTAFIVHDNVGDRDGTDTVVDVEYFQFADFTLSAQELLLGPPTPTIDSSISVSEGDSGTKQITLTVTLGYASGRPVEIGWATADGTATSSGPSSTSSGPATTLTGNPDFVGASGTITFAPMETTKTITVEVAGDIELEDDESFTVNLSAVSNVTIDPASATSVITITNDDSYNVITGTNGNNLLNGTAAPDMISGLNGNDRIHGLGGDDLMIGGAGNDFYYVEQAGDQVVELAGEGTDRVYSSVSWAADPTSEIEFILTTDTRGTDAIDLGGTDTANDIRGNYGNNVLTGLGGADTLRGYAGDDVLAGGDGDDLLLGGGGQDTAVFDGPAANYAIRSNGGYNVLVTDVTAGGGADDVRQMEILRFAGTDYTIQLGSNGSQLTASFGQSTIFFARNGNDTVNGSAFADILNGGAGMNTILAGNGDDLVTVDVADGGHDVVYGGSGTDTLQILGTAAAETFTVYDNASLPGGLTPTNGSAEIYITVTVGGVESIIAEAREIEEIEILTSDAALSAAGGSQTGATGDTINIVGDFTGTSLAYNTITVTGSGANDTVDISGLTSAHRLKFNSGGGADQVVGDLRPQDVVDFLPTSGNGSAGNGADMVPINASGIDMLGNDGFLIDAIHLPRFERPVFDHDDFGQVEHPQQIEAVRLPYFDRPIFDTDSFDQFDHLGSFAFFQHKWMASDHFLL
ncbi:peroxidase family protein [Stakelama marina]|uniref:Calx-beta domain-containing protein n=1 Tax=Stakelama marina TaxID=2826939 RepID=A0A8T4IB06_9SPHN|nr:peroxidase family protein [Stakelama marina]MBR0551004.1 hypothetical protein [Stakelama marina]